MGRVRWFPVLKPRFAHPPDPGRGPEVIDAYIVDFEKSPLRFAYDVLLAEYAALRAEIETVKQQIERTYAYMFAAVGAVLASQLISDKALKTLNKNPGIYLGAALAALWFPLNNMSLSVDMTSLGTYLREVLAPKLNNLVETVAQHAQLPDAIDPDEIIGWSQRSVARVMPEQVRITVRSPMSWEEFNPTLRLGRASRRALFIPLYIARSALLYAPSGLLVSRFIALSPDYGPLQLVLLTLIGCVACMSGVALFSLSGLVRFGRRSGPFRLHE